MHLLTYADIRGPHLPCPTGTTGTHCHVSFHLRFLDMASLGSFQSSRESDTRVCRRLITTHCAWASLHSISSVTLQPSADGPGISDLAACACHLSCVTAPIKQNRRQQAKHHLLQSDGEAGAIEHPQRAAEADDVVARRLDHVLDPHVGASAALSALMHLVLGTQVEATETMGRGTNPACWAYCNSAVHTRKSRSL